MISLSAPWVLPLIAEIHRWPGEVSDRKIRYGCIVIADVPQVGIPPVSRWVERLREVGVLAPAMVRALPLATAERIERLWSQRERAILLLLMRAGRKGMAVADLSERLDGCRDPGRAIEEPLVELYRGGLASPPAGLWLGARGLEMVGGGP